LLGALPENLGMLRTGEEVNEVNDSIFVDVSGLEDV
jgi:hypothetical protein